MSAFVDSFWGEKNNGFFILYQNMKYGHTSSKEFSDFLRESCLAEESYTKILTRLAKQAGNFTNQGTYAPFWQLLKTLTEKIANLHSQLMHTWQELSREVLRYNDEQHKKHKQIKDSEMQTQETVQNIQQTITALQKAKETYHAKCYELERLKQQNASQKEIERTETKHKKAQDEYRTLVDKYENVRNDFEKRMVESCEMFQQTEEDHLRQMRDFTDSYAKAWGHHHALIGQVHEAFKMNNNQLMVENLVQTFIDNKSTGTERPGPIVFEEPDLTSPSMNVNADSAEKRDFPMLEKPSKTGVPGFLIKSKRRRKKKKEEKDKKNSEENNVANEPKVDDEGYSVRPDNPFNDDKNSWYSSSDSDSDTEDRRRIKVEIKPFSPNGTTPPSNVDEIKKSIEGLRLSPTSSRKIGQDSMMKRSHSISDTLGGSKSGTDLLSLDPFGASSSSASTPTGVCELGASPAEVPPSVPSRRPIGGTTTPTSALLIGPPPPTKASPRTNLPPQATMRPTGRQSPALAPFSRTNSGSLVLNSTPGGSTSTPLTSFATTTSMPFGSSRGPSPLTLGLGDTIPIAVALSETANAIFKGTDESNCKLKLVGDLMLSFPAGIVRALTENPNPAMLSFKISSNQNLENILVNKQLVVQDSSRSSTNSTGYTFDMPALRKHLQKQTETNRHASFFNIDILKYQIKTQSGTTSAPLNLVCYWKCEPNQTDFRLDYRLNSSAMTQSTPLSNVSVLVPVDGEVTHLQSQPSATWSAENRRAVWKLSEINARGSDGGKGSLRAKFDLQSGPSNPNPVAVQFMCDNSSLSGIDFELAGPGYRISLIKKRFISGKYLAEPEYGVKYV